MEKNNHSIFERDKKIKSYIKFTNSLLQLIKDPVVCEIAAKNQKTAAQILLRWAVQQGIGNMQI